MEAQVTSVPITPEEFREWRQFYAVATVPGTTDICFDIMDHNGTVILKQDVENGENISEITDGSLRVRATFSRVTPQMSPVLDLWNVSCLVGRDIYPPVTTIAFDPSEPNGNNSWYISPVTVTFNVSDVDSDPENITTYFNINGFGVEIYNPLVPPVISSEGPENVVEYWSNDSINEELPHQRAEGIKIDTSPPMITLYEPPYIIAPGNVSINGSATEYFSGSGMKSLSIMVNDETIFDETYTGEQIIWFEWRFTADRGETYDIYVEATDIAGHTIADRRTVLCPDHGLYDPGYIYLFENPRIGPVNLLVTLGLSIAVNYDTLYVVLPGVHPDAVSVKFTAKQVFLGGQFVFWDTNLSDGCSCDLLVPFGFYEITATAYDDGDTVVEEYSVITKMLILLF
jgi:hypothetical protein